MEILNVGPLELLLIVILALVVFGPERMVEYSRVAARMIRKIIRSPFWRDLVSTSEEIKTIPQQLIKEADLEESAREISRLRQSLKLPIRLDDTTEKEPAKTDNSDEAVEEPDVQKPAAPVD